MLPTTSMYGNLGNMGLQSAAGLQSPSYVPAPAMGISNPSLYSSTGIPSLDGQSYAYPPGSPMTSFMDDLNSRVGLATKSPDGSSDVMTWANGLVMQAQLRKQQQQALMAQQLQAGATGSASASGASSIGQMLQMLMSMLMSQLQQSKTA